MQAFDKVTAPFSGIVTARNVDVGSLIPGNGGTPLFRIAQIGMLRIMVDVPQIERSLCTGRPGGRSHASGDIPAASSWGSISRTADCLDPNTRTLPTEVEVRNLNGALLPNMFAQVRLLKVGATPSVLIPGDALIVRSNGTQVATVVAERSHSLPADRSGPRFRAVHRGAFRP